MLKCVIFNKQTFINLENWILKMMENNLLFLAPFELDTQLVKGKTMLTE